MGHSRPEKGLDTKTLPNSVAYCSGGEDNMRTYYKLKSVLENNADRIKYVILPTGFPTFSLSRPERNLNSFYWSKYVDYIELAKITGDYSTYYGVYLRSKVLPYYEYPYIRVMWMYGDYRPLINDTLLNNQTPEAKKELAEIAVKTQYIVGTIGHPASYVYLKKSIELCKSYNKKIIFLKYPVTRYYKDNANQFMLDNNISLTKPDSIINSYEENIVLNYQNIYADSLHYFKDAHHLNDLGREKFTHFFLKEMEKYQ
jgi:hypothetical protein